VEPTTRVSETPSSTPAFFDERAGWYDGAYDRENADGYALRSRMQAVLRLLGDGPGAILDAGMGPGRLLGELQARSWTVSGIDAAGEMVAAARVRLPDAAERLLEAEISSLPFADESFDAVVATGVLEYSGVPHALAELARVLKPGGRAVVSYPNPEAYYAFWKVRVYYAAVRGLKRLARRPQPEMPRGAGVIPPRRFTPLLESVGLEPLEVVHTSFLVVPPPAEQLLPRLAVRLGHRLERRAQDRARRFSTQVVYAARKPPSA